MIQLANSNELFEGVDTSNLTPQEMVNAKKLYNYIVESAYIAKEQGKTIDEVMDEGLFSGLLGATVGATVGQSIMKAVVKILGIDPNGALGKLLTSQLILSALGAEVGYHW